MMRGWLGIGIAFAAALAGVSVAQDSEEAGVIGPELSGGAALGRIEYMAGCAQCHGMSGKGDGAIADYLTVAPPDLTVVARENDGVFPARVLYEIIEGTSPIGAHGTREMPAWGDRYSVEAVQALGWPLEPEMRDIYIRSRILALVDYIASMQAESRRL